MTPSTWNFIALDDLERACAMRGLGVAAEGEYCVVTDGGKRIVRTLMTQDRRIARHSVRHVFAYPVNRNRKPLA